MGQKFNWGAALTTLGGGIGDYADTKRREMAMKMLREQQQADLADQRAYDENKWLERLNITDPLMPVPKDVREYVGMPETQVGPMPGMNLPQYERTSTVGNWQNMLPPVPNVDTASQPDYYMQDAAGNYVPFSGQPWAAAGEGRRVNISGQHNGKPVVGLENWSAPTKEAAGPRASTPSEDRLAASELQKRIAAAVEGDIGNPATLLRNQASYDAKGKKVGTSFVDIPSRGGGQFINHDDFSYFENPEAAGNAYAGSLADSLALRGITTYDQLPGGVVPMDMRRNAWGNVVKSQPTVADMDFTLPLIADMKEPGWKFDDKGTADPLDDQFVNKRQWKPDQEMPVTDFMRTMVTPKADAEGRIEFKAFDSMFKKQYGVSYSDLIKGTAPEGF